MKSSEIKIAEYLLSRLKEIGVDQLLGVPGDFVPGFLNHVLKSDLQYVGTCNEINATYDADCYARIRGIGAFTSTYGVGELSAVNGVAGEQCRPDNGKGKSARLIRSGTQQSYW